MKERWDDDPRWLQMPLRKRDVALTRMAAMKKYEALKPRTAKDVETIASSIRVGRARLFDLLAKWRKTNSPVDLVPYAEPGRAATTTMPKGRAIQLQELAWRVLVEATDRTPGTLVGTVLQGWSPELGKKPARATILRYLEDAYHRMFGGPSGVLTAQPASFRREGNEVARRFGEVVVIDYMAVDIFVDDDGRAVRPIAALAIDLFTAAIVGVELIVGRPTPDFALAALRDAERRTSEWTGNALRPRLAFNATFDGEWTRLISELSRAGIPTSVRRTSRLQHGAAGQRLLRGRVGTLRLLARKAHSPDLGASEHDPDRHAVTTLGIARTLFESNLGVHVSSRVGESGAPLLFDVQSMDPNRHVS